MHAWSTYSSAYFSSLSTADTYSILYLCVMYYTVYDETWMRHLAGLTQGGKSDCKQTSVSC